MNDELSNTDQQLLDDVRNIIIDGKHQVAKAVNTGLTATYWNIGIRINKDILHHKRADYGKKIISDLSSNLIRTFGKGWSKQQLHHCLRFAERFPNLEKVSALWRQLSWTHFKSLVYLKSDLELLFYTEMCRIERWSTRTLQKQIDSMLFKRTAISKKPEELAKLELQNLSEDDNLSPNLIFKDHYLLDFLDLKDAWLENDLEMAILREIENFILELGDGFTFVERQKRMTIDNTDFKLDLLFFHRKLKRLIAIELKLGKFKPAYKGQMELYLRWLEKYETESWEEQPIGLVLCAEGNQEQVELLQLDKSNIRVAEYITEHLPKDLLEEKLHQFSEKAKELIETRTAETKI